MDGGDGSGGGGLEGGMVEGWRVAVGVVGVVLRVVGGWLGHR